MPQITLQFDPAVGPLLAIEIGFPSSARPPAGGLPPRESVNFLIDTGATVTSINPDTASKLNLPIQGLRPVVSVTQAVLNNEYLADLHLPFGTPLYHLQDWRLMEFPMGGTGIGGLLGRDLLQHGLFHMNGVERIFTIAL